ncbi:NifU-like protein 1, chloroplastic [Asimina triloba]
MKGREEASDGNGEREKWMRSKKERREERGRTRDKRVLKEKFGEAVKEIRQVSDNQQAETTVEAVNAHLDILRPAIKNYGGSVEVISVDGADCHVKYVGPESIGSGIKAAIKERFPDIVNVTFSA